MKKIIFIYSFLFLTFNCEAQNYEWQPISPGIDCDDSAYLSCRIRNFTVDTFQNILWVTGIFDGAAGILSPNCVGFDGTNWIAFPGVMDSLRAARINNTLVYNGDLIICRDNLVQKFSFTNNQWTTIGTASNGVFCLGIYNGDLIAAGGFFDIDGVPANRIARWDGTQWYPHNNGITGSSHVIKDVEVYNGRLFAGGAFDYADSNDAWNIAVWNGVSWNNLFSSGGSFGTDGLSGNHGGASVFDLEVFDNKLYITGQFEKVCNIICYLAYWDDTTWHGTSYPYGDGRIIKSINNKLVIESLGIPPPYYFLYYWDGANVSDVDTAFAGGEQDIEVFQNTLYSGGVFDNSGNTLAFKIARLMVFNPVYLNVGICTGDNYDFNGVLLDSAGVYTDTLTDASGLDSIVVLTLNVNEHNSGALTQIICEGESYNFNGIPLTIAGTYIDTINNVAGCDSAITLTLSVTLLNAGISLSNDTLTASGNGTIQWYNCINHQPISGATNNTYITTGVGSYAAIITNGNCSDTTACVTYIGVNDLPIADSELLIYPNPANETVTITANNITEAIVSNLLGEVVQSSKYKVQSNTATIDISKLPQGIYLLHVQTNDGWRVGKVVKE